jgi:hypothetical protein
MKDVDAIVMRCDVCNRDILLYLCSLWENVLVSWAFLGSSHSCLQGLVSEA